MGGCPRFWHLSIQPSKSTYSSFQISLTRIFQEGKGIPILGKYHVIHAQLGVLDMEIPKQIQNRGSQHYSHIEASKTRLKELHPEVSRMIFIHPVPASKAPTEMSVVDTAPVPQVSLHLKLGLADLFYIRHHIIFRCSQVHPCSHWSHIDGATRHLEH